MILVPLIKATKIVLCILGIIWLLEYASLMSGMLAGIVFIDILLPDSIKNQI